MRNKRIIFGLFVFTQLLCVNGFAQTKLNEVAPAGTAKFDPKNPPTETIVKNRETLFDIAERTRSPLEGIIEENNLTPPYSLVAGQKIKLPPLKVHLVQKGEKLETIAARYSINLRSLAVFNNLSQPYNIKRGQKIIMPAMVQDSLTGKEAIDLISLITGEINSGKKVSGNNGGAISIRRDNTIPQLPKGFSGIDSVSIAQPVNPVPKPKSNVPNPAINSPKPNIVTKPKSTITEANTNQINPPKTNVNPTPNNAIINVVNGRFSWPIKGNILETFGEKRNFVKNDGIDIAAPLNTPFKATADGEVAFVSDKLIGYGWLVLIKHKDGFLSTYAYANKIIVKEGDMVKKGQEIGLVGQTGRATSPRLHFQIRNGLSPIDPTPHLNRG